MVRASRLPSFVHRLSGSRDGRTTIVRGLSRSPGQFCPRGDGHGAGLGIEPAAMASLAAEDPHVLFQLPALRAAAGVAVLGQELGNDPFERSTPFVARGPAPPREGDVLLAGAPEQGLPHPFVELFPGRFQHAAGRKPVLALERIRHAAENVPFPAAHLPPFAQQLDASLLKRAARIGNQPLGIERVNLAQPAALGAHALGAVEAEQLRAGRFEALLAVGAGVVRGEGDVGRMKAEG